MKIGFIGLGIMGSRMAMNLQNAGYDLIVYNRTKEKADKLIEKGAEWGETVAKTAKKADILFTMLSTPEVVVEVALGENGFLENMKDNALWVNSSTVNPSFTRKMHEAATERKVRFLDAPVSGSLKPAEKGELIFLIGGDKKEFEEVREYLNVMGKSAVHAGKHGMGSAMKMVINKLLAEAMLSFAEGMKFGESMGLNKEILLDTLLNSIVVAPFTKTKRDNIEKGDFPAEFPLKWQQKDLYLATLSAYEKGVSIPSGNNAKEIYAMAKENGFGDKDMSAIYEFLTKDMEK